MRSLWYLPALFITFMALFIVAPRIAQAGLLGISGDYTLYDVNTANGALSNPRVVGNKVNTISISPSGVMYGVSQGSPFDFPPGGMLYTIDIPTGNATVVDTLDMLLTVEGDIAFDPTTGDLYAVESTGLLFKINTGSATGTAVGTIASNVDFSAMAFDATGTLWVLDSFALELHKVNKNTAAIISTTTLDPTAQEVGGLAFDPNGGTLYYAGGFGSHALYTVNTTTGSVVNQGPTTGALYGIWGLAFAQEPTPIERMSWGRIKAEGR